MPVLQGNAKFELAVSARFGSTAVVTFANHAERYAEGVIRASAGVAFAIP